MKDLHDGARVEVEGQLDAAINLWRHRTVAVVSEVHNRKFYRPPSELGRFKARRARKRRKRDLKREMR
jgi:ribosomal protein S21